MRDKTKINIALLFNFGLGLAAGALFSKSAYYKGKEDAYNEMLDILHENFDPLMEQYNLSTEEES